MVRTRDNAEVARTPSVAVTIVTYNSAKYISRCLRAVLEQDYPKLQVIVVDNASEDAPASQVREFGPRITLIQNAVNTGVCGRAESGDRGMRERLGVDAESGRAVDAKLYTQAGGSRGIG